MANNLVKLFYLGGLSSPGRKINIVRSRGKIFVLPPVGEALEVSQFFADDLIGRHKVDLKEGRFEAFTVDAGIARRVKELGDLKAQSAVFKDNRPKEITIEDVLAKFSAEDLQLALSEKMGEVDEDQEGKVKPRSKAKAKTSTAKKSVESKSKKPKAAVEEISQNGSDEEEDNEDFLEALEDGKSEDEEDLDFVDNEEDS